LPMTVCSMEWNSKTELPWTHGLSGNGKLCNRRNDNLSQ
jgi:hypothetical protein